MCWARLYAEFVNLGLKGVLTVFSDGLTGFLDTIGHVPDAIVQTCAPHLICASMKRVTWGQRAPTRPPLKPTCQAVYAISERPNSTCSSPPYGVRPPSHGYCLRSTRNALLHTTLLS